MAALDATNICTRWSGDDPSRWIAGPSAVVRSATETAVPAAAFSWWALARNPKAMALSGLVSLAVARDSLVRLAD